MTALLLGTFLFWFEKVNKLCMTYELRLASYSHEMVLLYAKCSRLATSVASSCVFWVSHV